MMVQHITLIDDLIILFSVFLCPYLNVIEHFDRIPLPNIIVVGSFAILFILVHNINAFSNIFLDNPVKSFYLENKNIINTLVITFIIGTTESSYDFIMRYG